MSALLIDLQLPGFRHPYITFHKQIKVYKNKHVLEMKVCYLFLSCLGWQAQKEVLNAMKTDVIFAALWYYTFLHVSLYAYETITWSFKIDRLFYYLHVDFSDDKLNSLDKTKIFKYVSKNSFSFLLFQVS